MSGSSYMTAAGLLYLFVAAGILCRVFFHFVSNSSQITGGTAAVQTGGDKKQHLEYLMDAAIALPLLVVGFGSQALGHLSTGALNWLGVTLMLALAFGLLYYACMKSTFVETLLARPVQAPARELPAPAVLLPRPEKSQAASPEPKPQAAEAKEKGPVADAVKAMASAKPAPRPPKANG